MTSSMPARPRFHGRSEEHTSELQSLTNLVCRLLLEKKNVAVHPAADEEGLNKMTTSNHDYDTDSRTLSVLTAFGEGNPANTKFYDEVVYKVADCDA